MHRSFDLQKTRRPIFDALLDAARQYGPKKPILEDQERNPLTYTDLIRAAFALGRKIAAMTQPGERVALLLPTSSAGVVTFFALHAFGRVPVMLNFTAGLRNLRAAVKLAGVKRVLSSHRFVEQGKLHDVIDALDDSCAVSYLEDVRASIGLPDRLFALAASLAPRRFRAATKPDDAAVVLFTSGSFGAPRGVILTQANVLANVEQIASHIELDPSWVMFNPLPIFHCFGLTGGVLLPILNGMKAFEYPSPLHVKIIPNLIRETDADILLATDTFVNQYARSADPEDLKGLKFVVCGAEKVRDETHDLIIDRFGPIPLLEGYGATETSPVIAVNKPGDNRRGTVGGLLPGVETRVEPVQGINRGGRLFVRGPNIMAGYLNENGVLEAPDGGWHDTGDVVEISADNWITILGRVKRFAKIGGEMVSLTAAETLAAALWPDSRHAVIAEPDTRKGERLVLVTDRRDADVAQLLAHAQAIGVPELSAPRKIVRVAEIPLLGTGKTDYVAIQRMVETEARAA
ncbi:MAG TPA: AMP-binding protein [Caulobacteraceae bacterium]|jgi:acyl-[acyl-carrier-protein]-phospholipid O-acyltransferase/long-chain-fatty-acid--[acyl-carrier-protein] ligase|nr:AMP-binding protein [Caulobacteraceae bacterium]